MNHQSPISAVRVASIGVTLVFALQLSLGVAFSQTQTSPPDIPVAEIIKRFSEKELEFRAARANYAFRQEVRVQELGTSDRVVGEYQTSTDIYFDEKGKRAERIVYAPQPTLRRISMTKEDLQNLRDIQPFVLTSDDIGKYNLKYGGREKIDEIGTYVFDVSPKVMEKGQLYFEGKIWVDDQDFQIVKTYGKPVPDLISKDNENLFPRFETYREQIDGYWFPTYTRSLDTLDFSSGAVKIRQIVRYTNYKRFQTSFQIRAVGEVPEGGATGGQAPAQAPPQDRNAPVLDPKYKTDPKAAPKK
jgi:hypothetical protein